MSECVTFRSCDVSGCVRRFEYYHVQTLRRVVLGTQDEDLLAPPDHPAVDPGEGHKRVLGHLLHLGLLHCRQALHLDRVALSSCRQRHNITLDASVGRQAVHVRV